MSGYFDDGSVSIDDALSVLRSICVYLPTNTIKIFGKYRSTCSKFQPVRDNITFHQWTLDKFFIPKFVMKTVK